MLVLILAKCLLRNGSQFQDGTLFQFLAVSTPRTAGSPGLFF